MALIVDQLDYSPIYQGLSIKAGGAQSALTAERGQHEAFAGFIDLGLSIGGAIYNKVEQTKAAQAKLETFAFQDEAEQRQRDAIANRTVTWEQGRENAVSGAEGNAPAATGSAIRTVRMPQEYEDWYKGKLEEIDQKYSGFPRVQEWARDQASAAYSQTKNNVLGYMNNQAIKDHAALDQQVIARAGQTALKTRNFKNVEAAVGASSSLNPEAKTGVLLIEKQSFDAGIRSLEARETTMKGGLTAGITYADKELSAGRVTEAEHADMLKSVQSTFNEQSSLHVAQAAQTFYAEMGKDGMDVERALTVATQNTEPAYRESTEAKVRSLYNEKVKQIDEEANKEMLAAFNAKPDDWAGMRLRLEKPENNYAKRMEVNSYFFWHRLSEAPSNAVGGEVTTPKGEYLLREATDTMAADPMWMTNEIMDISRMRGPDGKPLVSQSRILTALSFANSDRPTVVWQQWNTVGDYAKQLLKEKGKSTTEQIQAANTAQVAFSAELEKLRKEIPKPTEQQIINVGNLIIRGMSKPGERPAPVALGDRNAYRNILINLKKKNIPPTDTQIEQASTFLIDRFKTDFGAKAVQSGSEAGLPVFTVMGLVEAPTIPYIMRYTLDEKDNEVLQTKSKGSEGVWITAPFKTIAQARSDADKAKAKQDLLEASQLQKEADIAARAKAKAEAKGKPSEAPGPVRSEAEQQKMMDALSMGTMTSAKIRKLAVDLVVSVKELRDLAARMTVPIKE